MTEHTKEPWKIGTPPPNGEQTIGTYDGLMVAVSTTGAGVNAEANARRVVACVNAMAGIDDDNVLFRCGRIGTVRKHIATQQVQIEKLTAQRDQLLAALEAIMELHDSARRGSDVAATISNARAAIAAVKGD